MWGVGGGGGGGGGGWWGGCVVFFFFFFFLGVASWLEPFENSFLGGGGLFGDGRYKRGMSEILKGLNFYFRKILMMLTV